MDYIAGLQANIFRQIPFKNNAAHFNRYDLNL